MIILVLAAAAIISTAFFFGILTNRGLEMVLAISSIPVGIITAMGMVSLYRWIKKDFGHASAAEIVAFFTPESEMKERLETVKRLEAGIPEESAANDGASGAELLNPFHRSKASKKE